MNWQKTAVIFIATILAVYLINGIFFSGNIGGGDVIELDGVEITEYQGENLSSVNDFRENSIEGAQYVDIENYALNITGLVENYLTLNYEEILENNQHYQKVVTLYCVEGWDANILWEGILFKDLVAEAGILPEAAVVIFHAYDGYTTSLSVEYLIENNIMIAYKMNGVIIPPERGYPFVLVAESKWGYKWIVEIEFSDDVDYRGYWEGYGYSNKGDLDDSFFD